MIIMKDIFQKHTYSECYFIRLHIENMYFSKWKIVLIKMRHYDSLKIRCATTIQNCWRRRTLSTKSRVLLDSEVLLYKISVRKIETWYKKIIAMRKSKLYK